MQDIISEVLSLSEVAVLFSSNLCTLPFLRLVVESDLLLYTGINMEHADLLLCPMFTQRQINDQKIEQNNGCCFGWQQLLTNFIKNFKFRMKKK